MGFVGFLKQKYLRICAKMVREKVPPEYVARGWAIGMFYGCLIPFGLQLILSVPTALLLKGSKVGAVLGTLITNHFTIFVIYPAQCWLGNHLIGGSLSYSAASSALADVVKEQSFESLFRIGGELVASFFIGGAILTAVMTPITYYSVLALVRRRRARRQALEQKKEQEAK